MDGIWSGKSLPAALYHQNISERICLRRNVSYCIANTDIAIILVYLRHVNVNILHTSEYALPGTCPPPPGLSGPDMHQSMRVTHVRWCMPGSLTSGFLWSQWRRKGSQHSRRMRNPQYDVFGKMPMLRCQSIHLYRSRLLHCVRRNRTTRHYQRCSTEEYMHHTN